MKQLSSRHHPLVATCRALARGGKGDTRLLLDGPHLVADASRAGLRFHAVAATARLLDSAEGRELVARLRDQDAVVEVSEVMMAAMSPVSSPSGILAIADRPSWTLPRLFDASPALLVAGLDIQEPGNVGAVVRTAEAFGAAGAIFCGASADPFGWKALRGSMGSSLRLPVVAGLDAGDLLDTARSLGVQLAAAVPRGGVRPADADLRQPCCFLLGGEGPGLAADVLAVADLRLSLPMRPPVESLNVAVAAALLLYEAARQRGTA